MKTMIKKLSVLLTAAMLPVALSACGTTGQQSETLSLEAAASWAENTSLPETIQETEGGTPVQTASGDAFISADTTKTAAEEETTAPAQQQTEDNTVQEEISIHSEDEAQEEISIHSEDEVEEEILIHSEDEVEEEIFIHSEDEVEEESSMHSENEAQEVNVMKITAGNTTFTAALADNSSAEALKELLAKGPITINMSDYADMEKVGAIGTSLPRNDEQITTNAGDIILYQGNSLVIYYDTNSWNFTRIGKIDGVTGEELLDAFGEGDVTVTFSLE